MTNVRVAALFNRSDVTANMTVTWSQLGLPSASATVRDLWAGTDRGTFASRYYRIAPRHSGKDMVVQSASTAEGANIFQWTYGGSATNDEWAIVAVGSGYYRITNRNGGKSAEASSCRCRSADTRGRLGYHCAGSASAYDDVTRAWSMYSVRLPAASKLA